MSGDQWTARLSEYIDGDLPADERQGLEAHLAACAECQETMAQLRRVRVRAGGLEDRPPQVDLWPGIAERIGVNTGTYRVPAPTRRWTFSMPQLAAAAVVLMLVGAGAMWVALRPAAPDAGMPIAAESGRGAAPIARLTAVEGYDHAVADLERVLAENRDRLDSATVRVLEESLVIIDRAIARAREALAADPGDEYLNAYLADTMRRKVALLRRAADIATASL